MTTGAGGGGLQPAPGGAAAFDCGHVHNGSAGRLDESARRLSHEELSVAEAFRGDGHDVRSVADESWLSSIAVSQPPKSSIRVALAVFSRKRVATSAVSTVDQSAGLLALWAATRSDQEVSASVFGPVAT